MALNTAFLIAYLPKSPSAYSNMSSINSECHPVHLTLPSYHSSVSIQPYYDAAQAIARNGQWHPDIATSHFDVHESEIAYFLEGEFPGIADKSAITLEQVGP